MSGDGANVMGFQGLLKLFAQFFFGFLVGYLGEGLSTTASIWIAGEASEAMGIAGQHLGEVGHGVLVVVL